MTGFLCSRSQKQFIFSFGITNGLMCNVKHGCHSTEPLASWWGSWPQTPLYEVLFSARFVCLSVCLSVRRITEELWAWCSWNLVEECSMGQGRTQYIWEWIRIMGRVHKLLFILTLWYWAWAWQRSALSEGLSSYLCLSASAGSWLQVKKK